tara:strand:+ start:871 stop:1101 length:231 start_codon:yes stop_codon:yes gene_type:complete
MDGEEIKNNMDQVVLQIINKPLALKKTNNIYSDKFVFSAAERVESYYIENNKKFTWLKPWNGNIYIYGDPSPSYNF